MVDKTEAGAVVGALREGDFVAVMGPEKAERLRQFIITRGVPAGGFFINLPITEGGHASFLYEIVKPTRLLDRIIHRGKLALHHDRVLMPAKAGMVVDLPEEYRKYPIWWLD